MNYNKALIWLVATMTAATDNPASAQFTFECNFDDSECPTGFTCGGAGECGPKTTQPDCQTDDQCASDSFCYDGRKCVPKGDTVFVSFCNIGHDDTCLGDLVCNDMGRCDLSPLGGPGSMCDYRGSYSDTDRFNPNGPFAGKYVSFCTDSNTQCHKIGNLRYSSFCRYKDGEECGDPADNLCAPGSACTAATIGGQQKNVCVPEESGNIYCSTNNDCAGYEYCVPRDGFTYGICDAQLDVGMQCAHNEDCVSGRCVQVWGQTHNLCEVDGAVQGHNTLCENDSMCNTAMDYYCINKGRCGSPNAEEEFCSKDEHCEGSLTCNLYVNKCDSQGVGGAVKNLCNDDTDCEETGTFCASNGRCGKEVGLKCSEDSECASGACPETLTGTVRLCQDNGNIAQGKTGAYCVKWDDCKTNEGYFCAQSTSYKIDNTDVFKCKDIGQTSHENARYYPCQNDSHCEGTRKCNQDTLTCDSRGYGGGAYHNCRNDGHCSAPWSCAGPEGKMSCRKPIGYGCKGNYQCASNYCGSNGKCDHEGAIEGVNSFCSSHDDCNHYKYYGRDPTCETDYNYYKCACAKCSKWWHLGYVCRGDDLDEPRCAPIEDKCTNGKFGPGCAYSHVQITLSEIKVDANDCSDEFLGMKIGNCDHEPWIHVQWGGGTNNVDYIDIDMKVDTTSPRWSGRYTSSRSASEVGEFGSVTVCSRWYENSRDKPFAGDDELGLTHSWFHWQDSDIHCKTFNIPDREYTMNTRTWNGDGKATIKINYEYTNSPSNTVSHTTGSS